MFFVGQGATHTGSWPNVRVELFNAPIPVVFLIVSGLAIFGAGLGCALASLIYEIGHEKAAKDTLSDQEFFWQKRFVKFPLIITGLSLLSIGYALQS